MKAGLIFLCALLVATTIQGQGQNGGTRDGRIIGAAAVTNAQPSPAKADAQTSSNVMSLKTVVQNKEQSLKSTHAINTVSPPIQSLTDKMGRIIIPEIEFRQANIHDVVDFLVKASIAGDTATTDPRIKGVNIILNLRGFAGVPQITFTAREVTLLQAIKAITQVSGLRYYVEGNAVMVVPRE